MTEKDNAALQALLSGRAPENKTILQQISVEQEPMVEFLRKHYLSEYIPAGGSKIKFLCGQPGSGKTHNKLLLEAEAQAAGYITVSFSARDVAMYDFREVYRQCLTQCDFDQVLKGCRDRIIQSMGVEPAALQAGQTLMDYLSERGEGDVLVRKAIRDTLRKNFTRNPLLDREFGSCCSLLLGDLLGHPVLEPAHRELIRGWMMGDPAVKAAQIRALGMTPVGVTKFNARHLLRSLAEVVHMAGYQGMMVTVDDLESLMNSKDGNGIKYTKGKREDSYESIRQLIDEIDSMRFLLFIFCMDRKLIDDENTGIKTYQALWLRIQNEVVGHRFNSFADILNLDRYEEENLDEQALMEMAGKLKQTLEMLGAKGFALTAEQVQGLKERSQYGAMGLPYMVNRAVVEGEKADV